MVLPNPEVTVSGRVPGFRQPYDVESLGELSQPVGDVGGEDGLVGQQGHLEPVLWGEEVEEGIGQLPWTGVQAHQPRVHVLEQRGAKVAKGGKLEGKIGRV